MANANMQMPIVARRGFMMPGGRPVVIEGTVCMLTRRQHEVLELVSKGHGDKATGRILCIAVSTVKDHAVAACKALGARNRAHACTIATRQGVI